MADLIVPDEHNLRLFLLGRLAGPDAERVEHYLESHPEAADTLRGLVAEDTFTSALRGQPAAEDVPPNVRAFMTRLEQLVPPSGDQTTPFGSGDDSGADATRSAPGDAEGVTEDDLSFLSPARGPGELGWLGPYRVLRVLGAGGMGMVLDAEDPQLGRHVAIKVMRPRVATNAKAKERFLREARAAGKVEHDHIVPVYFVGEDNGVPYIVMPFLKGESLDARLKREGRVPAADVVRIGREAAEGLAAAHDLGLVHRDIKPANLWLEAPRGRVKVLDFGLARLNSEAGQLTQSGAIVGTPAYMAPEQARGQRVDARSDLFSLGAVLYRMATGRLPFRGSDTMSMLTSLAVDTPEHPRRLNPDLPPHLAELIVRLLDKDPARRPPSAREVIGLLAQPTAEAQPPGAGRRRESDADPAGDPRVEVPRAEPAGPRASRPAGRGLTPVGIAVAALALIGFGLGTYKLVFETRDGTLIVEVDRDADVRFKDGQLEIRGEDGRLRYTLAPDEKNKTLPPGRYTIHVAGADGLTVNAPEFRLEKGGEAKVYVIVDQGWKPAVARKEPGTGKAVDLLALVDPRRDTVSGRWQVEDGTLVGGGRTPVDPIQERLQVPYSPPVEYDMRLMVERTASFFGGKPVATRGGLCLMFAGPSQFQLMLDVEDGKVMNGIQLIGGKLFHSNETSFQADLFRDRKAPVRVECEIRRAGVNVRIDGKDYVRWTGDVTRLRVHEPYWSLPDRTRLAVGVQNAEYRIHEWTVTPVGPVSPDPDRRAAEALKPHAAGLVVRLPSGDSKAVDRADPLPVGPFALTGLVVGEAVAEDFVPSTLLPAVADLKSLAELRDPSYRLHWSEADLARLAETPAAGTLHTLWTGFDLTRKNADTLRRFPRLTRLGCLATRAGDDELGRLRDLPPLTELGLAWLGQARIVGSAGWAAVTAAAVRRLDLTAGVVPAGFAQRIARMPDLEHLTLAAALLDDDALPELVRCPRLRGLDLSRAAPTDADLDVVSRMKGLRELRVRDGRVTEEGVRKLAAALPDCRVEWDAGVIEPHSPAGPDVAVVAGDRPPPKDLFPGDVVAYETFDRPTADWPPAKLPAGIKCAVADGVLRTEFPNDRYDFGHTFGPPAPDAAFAVRLRATNAGAFVNFAFRRAPKSDSWLMLTLLHTGGWTLHQVIAGAGPDRPARERVLLAEAAEVRPDLAAGQWVTLKGRAVGTRYDVWANGRAVCGGTMTGPAGAPKPDAGGLEVGPVFEGASPSRLEIDHVAVWKLSPAAPGSFRNSLGLEFARVPRGRAWLGGGGGKPGDREIEFQDDFFLGAYPVTQEEWEKVMGSNPAHFSRNGSRKDAVKDVPDGELKRFPVEGVSFADVEQFLTKLNEQDKEAGWEYRLPTGDEWEYACRGGPIDRAASAFSFYVGEPSNELAPDKANYARVGGLNRTVKVGQFSPNRLGLYDMHANVLEWTSDRGRNDQGQETRFARGGSWNDPAGTAASRIGFLPTVRFASLGVRVARVPKK